MKKILTIIGILCLGLGSILAQTVQVSGTITSAEDGQPLPGVSIVVKGSMHGTVTDANGKYSLDTPANATLLFSFVGMATQEIEIADRRIIDVVLATSAREIEEVVVTALGITRSQKALGYAAVTVNPDEATLKAEPDMLKALQGRVAGVDIRSSQGTPGAATRINVRGNSSFFGDNEPLIVVDGVPMSNEQVTTSSQTSGGGAYTSAFSSIDPNDIESMTVLKGSSAAALYGSRASNGAVIIKTKSGSISATRKKLEVTLMSSFSLEQVASMPDYQNTYGPGSAFTYSNSNGSWGPRFDQLETIPAWPDYLKAFPEMFPNGTVPYVAKPDNVKDLFRTGTIWENSANISGGNENAAFNATLSNMNHNGYVPNSSYLRNSISLGGSAKLLNGLNIRGTLSYTNAAQEGSIFGENQVEGSASSFARTLFLGRNWDLTGYPYENPVNGGPVSTNSAQYDNPLWAWEHNTVSTDVDRIMGTFGADYDITPWLNVNYQIGTNLYYLNRKEMYDMGSRAVGGKGQITEDNYKNQETESTLLVTLKKSFMEDFSVTAILGNNFNEKFTQRQRFQGTEFKTPGVYNLSNTNSVLPLTDKIYKSRIIGIFADISLGYKNWAYLTLVGRNDWSSTLPKENRSYFYPAVSGSIIFTEAFDMHSDILTFGKIRAGWAKVGRDADPYSLRDTYELKDPFKGQAMATVYNTKNNADLKPEFSQEVEIGTQLDFFNRRVALDLAWYNKISTSLIATIALPPSAGYTYAYNNFGKIKNTGVEIDLMLKPVVTKDWDWEIHGIFTQNKNTVEELMDGVDRIQLVGVLTGISPYLEPGMPFGYLRGTVSTRDNDGNLLINPSTGLLIETPEEQMVGNPYPDYKMGISSLVTYKGFFLSVLFDYTKGGDVYSVTVSSLLGRGVTKDTEDREHSWIIPGYYGDPNTGKPLLDADGRQIPNTTAVSTNDLYFGGRGESFAINASTEWEVYDATVYRLRELTFGYDVPKKFLTKLPIGSASLSFTARNLWYFAPNVPKYTNFDPEINSFGSTTTQGIELSGAPTTRRFGVTLRLSF